MTCCRCELNFFVLHTCKVLELLMSFINSYFF